MKAGRVRGLLFCGSLFALSSSFAFTIAEKGRITADIVIPSLSDGIARYAAEELAYHIGKATGEEPQIVCEDKFRPENRPCHIFVGATKSAAAAGLPGRALKPEERMLKTVGNALYLMGGDVPMRYEHVGTTWVGASAWGTLYAIYDFLETEMGVKWIWPGETGEVIPKRKDVAFAAIDRVGIEPLVRREWLMYYSRNDKLTGFTSMEARRKYFRDREKFLTRQRVGRREEYIAGHAFRSYWKRFGETHPEYFNLLPNGKREKGGGRWSEPTMCVSEPGLWRQIVADWQVRCEKMKGEKKNSPLTYHTWVNCCENDSAGQCTCARCRAWDGPDPRFKTNPYWNGTIKDDLKAVPYRLHDHRYGWYTSDPRGKPEGPSLSDRYAKYYNHVLEEARKVDPAARVVGYAYVNYTEAPLATRVDPGVVIEYVSRSHFPYDVEESRVFRRDWLGWRHAGVRDMVHRPNFTHALGILPIDQGRLIADDFAFAFTNGMFACRFDSLMEAWASTPVMSYALVRMMRDPLRGYEKARGDVSAAFGKAASVVDCYFDYVEKFTKSWTRDKFLDVQFANVTPDGVAGGGFNRQTSIVGEFFTDRFFRDVYALLSAARDVADGDAEVEARIRFLYEGIRNVELTRTCRLAQKAWLADKKNASLHKAFMDAFAKMNAYRAEIQENDVFDLQLQAHRERDFLGWPHKPMEAKTPRISFGKPGGPVKPVNGVGQGPLLGYDNYSMFTYLKEAGVPYARLHDVGGAYGKNIFVDIPNVFHDFDADETKPENYDFAFTDRYLNALVKNGVEPYYRLGVTIENAHYVKAYRIHPPKDFAKWARICEHVIRHYTEGWANGYKMDISHWEIWNEPENYETIEKNQMWKAPFSEYIRLYAVVAPYLKKKFPKLKIGGYASCGFYGVSSSWAKPENARIVFLHKSFTDFLAACRDGALPLDFFSFHCYDSAEHAARQIAYCRKTLDEYGFKDTEMSLNEWLCHFSEKKRGTSEQIAGIAAMLCVMQNGAVDDAEIYDARATGGTYAPLFDPETHRPRKAYGVFLAFNELRKLGTALPVTAKLPDGVYATAATDAKEGEIALLAVNTRKDVTALDLSVLDGWLAKEVRVIDGTHEYANVSVPKTLSGESVWLVKYRRAR